MPVIKISSLKELQNHPMRNDIESWLHDEIEIKEIQKWVLEKGYEISLKILRRLKKELFKTVIETVHEKSAKLVEELSTERLNLVDDIENSIKQLDSILNASPLEDLVPRNSKELAALLQAKANLVRAELEAKGEAPRKNLQILELIKKSKELKEDKTIKEELKEELNV